MYSGDEYYDDDVTSGLFFARHIRDEIARYVTFSEDGRKAKLLPPEQLPRINMLHIIELVAKYNKGQRFL